MLGIILLGSTALDPFSDMSVSARVILLIVAAVLAAGLIPNSYLHRFTAGSFDRTPRQSSRLILLLSVFGPLLLAAVSVFGMVANLDTLRLIERLEITFIDPPSAIYDLILFAVLGSISLLLLAWNLVDLIRMRKIARSI